MKILDRYIATTILRFSAYALAGVFSIDSLFFFLDQLGEVGRDGYTLTDALTYMALTSPRRVYVLLPMAVLLGAMMGLGGLSNARELTAMRAAGVSIGRITWSVVKVGLLLGAFTLFLGEGLVPISEHEAQVQKARGEVKNLALNTRYGLWVREGDLFINVAHILPDATLQDVTMYQLDENFNIKRSVHAEEVVYQGGKWQLRDVVSTRFGELQLKASQADTLDMKSLLKPDLLEILVVRPESLSIWGLFQYTRYLNDNNQNAARYELAFWNKVLAPLVNIVMLLVTIPLVFANLRVVSISQRVIQGIMIGLLFFMFNKGLGYTGLVMGFPSLISASLPALLFGGGALFWLKKQQ